MARRLQTSHDVDTTLRRLVQMWSVENLPPYDVYDVVKTRSIIFLPNAMSFRVVTLKYKAPVVRTSWAQHVGNF